MTRRAGSMVPPLQTRLRAGEPVLMTFNALSDPAVIELAGLVGFDGVVLDLEHGPGGLREVEAAVRAADVHGLDLLVRTPRRTEIGGVLDLGAKGVMVPMVDDAEAASAAVAAARFPPQGRRGLAGSHRASGYGVGGVAATVAAGLDTVVVVQLETPTAVDDVEAIAAVPGVDVLFMGPTDLASSTGALDRSDDGWFREQLERVTGAARPEGVVIGTLVSGPARARIAIDLGVTLILWSTTTTVLANGLAGVVGQWREALGHDGRRG